MGPVDSVLSVIICIYCHCTSNMVLWSVKIVNCVYTSLILVKFSYFLCVVHGDLLVGMVSHKSGYQLYLCVRCTISQKVRTLHSHLVRCYWDDFLLWGLPTHNLRLWVVAYFLFCRQLLMPFVTTLGFALTLSNNEGAWVVMETFRLSVLGQGSSFILSLTVLNPSL